jgi:predicted acetyltransferase
MSAPDVRIATPGDVTRLAENSAWAFGSAAAEITPWFERIGFDNIRILADGDRLLAQMAFTWMGQYVGGRAVPMAGVAAVAVPPDARGLGAGTKLMQAALREARAAGYPLSGLYPATQPIYRSVGYEQAGTRWKTRVDAAKIDVKDHALEVAPITESDHAAIEEVYRAKARRHEGHLDRNDYIWKRIFKPKGEPPRAMKVVGNSGIEGYVVLSKTLREASKADFACLDVATLTPAAGRRILSLFADHKSLANEFTWYGGPDDPLLYLLREQEPEMEAQTFWMLRLLDVPRALEARGYAPGRAGELHLKIDDPLFPENDGPWILTVEDGRGRVVPGGRGSFRTTIRGMAPLYSGFLRAGVLAAIGWVEAPESELRAAEALFDGPAPWLPDMY